MLFVNYLLFSPCHHPKIMAVDVRANVTKTLVAADIILMSGKNFVHISHNLEILRIGSFHFANTENQGKRSG